MPPAAPEPPLPLDAARGGQQEPARGRGPSSAGAAGVAELADAPDLGSGAARRGGSSPFARTKTRRLLAPDREGETMQVTETLNEGLKRGYTVTVTAAELDAEGPAKLAEVQPDIAMKGFRKGKVPMALLRKQHGPRLMGEAMQESHRRRRVLASRSLGRPPGDAARGQDGQRGLEGGRRRGRRGLLRAPARGARGGPRRRSSLTRLKVAAGRGGRRGGAGATSPTPPRPSRTQGGRRAEDGDQVVIDFVGKVDGEAFEGGSATTTRWCWARTRFIPGFEDQLVGVAGRRGEGRERHLPGETTAPRTSPARTRSSPARSRP